MIREDRELLAELAQLNGDMASLTLRIMEGGAGEEERYTQRLITAGERLWRRADEMNRPVIVREILPGKSIALPAHTVEFNWRPQVTFPYISRNIRRFSV